MNLYFRSIGFSNIDSHRELQQFIRAVSEAPDEQYILGKNNSDTYIECYKTYGERFGLMIRGNMDDKEDVTIDDCYPYSVASFDLSCSNVEIELVEGDYIVAACDDETGNELVFHLQNVLDYLEEDLTFTAGKVNIVGMSLNGTVVLPVAKDEESLRIRREEDEFYREMSQKARAGDTDAQSMLDEQEAEMTETMRERLKEEDFLSVVEGFFMPMDDFETGYSILADIETVEALHNRHTNETIYKLLLNVTGTRLEVCINEDDLTGVPGPGMRFMGSCWLQGRLVY